MPTAQSDELEELRDRLRSTRRALEQREREARLAAHIGAAVTHSSSLAEKLDACAQAMVAELDAAFARIWTFDEPEETLVLQASAGLYTHRDGGHARVPVGAFKIGRIAARREPHLSNDVPHDPEVSDTDWAVREKMVAFAGYPLLVAQRCVGVMALFARHELPQGTLDALAAIADVIAVVVEQSRDAERLHERAAQMRRLAETATAINTADTVNDILQIVTDESRALTGAHQAVTSVTRGTDWAQAITAVSLSERYERWRSYNEAPDGTGIYSWVCETQQPVRMTQAELEAHPLWRGFGTATDHPPMRGWLAAPLTDPDGSNFGLVQLSDKHEGEFTAADEAVVVQIAGIASSAIHKTMLHEDRARVAHALQQSLLPPALPQIPAVDLAARYRAGTDDVGGDFYDVFPLRGRSWGLVIGDVRGKGPDAAAVTALARHSTRTAAMLQRRPRKVLAIVNDALCDAEDPERFCSAAFVRLTTASDEVRLELSSGGHPPLYLLRAGGEVEALAPTGPLLGLFTDIGLGEHTVHLRHGDALVAYTDGITEARRGGTLFGQYKLTTLLASLQGADAETIAEAVSEAAAAFGDTAEADDAAVVVVKFP